MVDVKMGLKVEFPVFVETNLGTRIAVLISQDITTSFLKREVERAHVDIFPERGVLSIHALTVKRDSNYYHLPDSFPVKYVFQDVRNFWLFHAETSLPDSLEKTSLLGSTVSKRKVTRKTMRLQRADRKVSLPESERAQGPDEKGHNLQKVSNLNATTETHCESSPGDISVADIIDRYFTGFITFGENHVEGQLVKKTPSRKSVLCSPLSQELSSVNSRRYERSEVGKRLVTASYILSPYRNSHGSSLLKDKRLRGLEGSSIVRNLVFEVDDSD